MDKRGQGLSTNAIVLIILGIFILVILILGFSLGWDKLLPFLSKENVNDVVQGCNLACLNGEKYDFCIQTRELIDSNGNKVETTCHLFSIADELEDYGIEECNIDCSKKLCEEIEIVSKGDSFKGNKIPDTGTCVNDVSAYASDLVNQKCCIDNLNLK